jgi:hypothetical protein
MPLWELSMLLENMERFLPHILYGTDGAHAAANQPTRVDDAAALPGMIVDGA